MNNLANQGIYRAQPPTNVILVGLSKETAIRRIHLLHQLNTESLVEAACLFKNRKVSTNHVYPTMELILTRNDTHFKNDGN